jgi:zinc protease
LNAASSRAGERTAFTLDNGLRVRLLPCKLDNKVVLLLAVRAGFVAEPAKLCHLAHVTEHLTVFDLKAGSAEAKAVARWSGAGQANAETLADFMYFDLQVSPKELPLALRVQAARLNGIDYSRETLAREIPRTLAEVEFLEKAEQGGTAKFALAPFVQAVRHGQAEVPLKAITRGLTIDQVRAFHDQTFRPDRAILSVVGDIDAVAARKEIERLFGAIPKPANEVPAVPALPEPGLRTVRWDVQTQHVILAWPAPAATEADHAALTLLSFLLMGQLFGDAKVSALAKLPLVANDAEGIFLINAEARQVEDLKALQTRLLERVAQVATPDSLKETEFQQLRMALLQSLRPTDLEKVPLPANVSRSLAAGNMELQLISKEIVWGDLADYAKRLEALDAAAVRATAARRLDPKKAIIVQVQPIAAK